MEIQSPGSYRSGGCDRALALPLPPAQVIGCSVDSHFSHLAWANTPRKQGGLGGCSYPLLADLTKDIARDYEVLIEDGPDAGVALR